MHIWPPNAAKCCKNAGKFFPDEADAKCRDWAFKKDIQLNLQQIYILCRLQITHITPPTTKIQEVGKEPAKLPLRNQATI